MKKYAKTPKALNPSETFHSCEEKFTQTSDGMGCAVVWMSQHLVQLQDKHLHHLLQSLPNLSILEATEASPRRICRTHPRRTLAERDGENALRHEEDLLQNGAGLSESTDECSLVDDPNWS